MFDYINVPTQNRAHRVSIELPSLTTGIKTLCGDQPFTVTLLFDCLMSVLPFIDTQKLK